MQSLKKIIVICYLLLNESLARQPYFDEVIRFHTNGFEECTFHFDDFVSRGDYVSLRYIYRDVIIFSNQGVQPWIIADQAPVSLDEIHRRKLTRANYCSINIVLYNQCFHPDLFYWLEGRPRNPSSMTFLMVFITADTGLCTFQSGRFQNAHQFPSPLLAYKLSGTPGVFGEIFALCVQCANSIPLIRIRNTLKLGELKEQSECLTNDLQQLSVTLMSDYSDKYHIGVEALRRCIHYSHDNVLQSETNWGQIACEPAHILFEKLKYRYNFTVRYVNKEALLKGWRPTFLSIVSAGVHIVIGHTNIRLMLSLEQLVEEDETNFVYCSRNPAIRKNFDFRIWFIPFDTPTWGLVVTSIVSINLLENQIPKAGGILISFALVLISSHYDSLMSSHVTVPPDFVKIETLKELIVDNSYKIQGYGKSTARLYIEMKNKAVIYGGVTEKQVNDSLYQHQNDNAALLDGDIMRRLQWGNTTSVVRRIPGIGNLVEEWEVDFRFKLPNIRCHILKEPTYSTDDRYGFDGIYRYKFKKIIQNLFEIGFLQEMRRLTAYTEFIKVYRSKENTTYHDNLPNKLKLLDWKIGSVFLACLVLLCAHTTLFLFELCSLRIKEITKTLPTLQLNLQCWRNFVSSIPHVSQQFCCSFCVQKRSSLQKILSRFQNRTYLFKSQQE